MKTTAKSKTSKKITLCNCKSNLWNIRRRYRRLSNRVARISPTYGLLRA